MGLHAHCQQLTHQRCSAIASTSYSLVAAPRARGARSVRAAGITSTKHVARGGPVHAASTSVAGIIAEAAQATATAVGAQTDSTSAAAAAKKALLEVIEFTRRGSNTDRELRGRIEEAQVAVEAISGPELDYSLLAGKWKLLYTTAPDVVRREGCAACGLRGAWVPPG